MLIWATLFLNNYLFLMNNFVEIEKNVIQLMSIYACACLVYWHLFLTVPAKFENDTSFYSFALSVPISPSLFLGYNLSAKVCCRICSLITAQIMANTEDNFDEHEHDSSDNEGSKKAYENLLSNPSYLSSSMKVRNKMRFKIWRNISQLSL